MKFALHCQQGVMSVATKYAPQSGHCIARHPLDMDRRVGVRLEFFDVPIATPVVRPVVSEHPKREDASDE